MATTMYFGEHIKDQGKENEIYLEFGRSSYWEEESIYFEFGDEVLIVDRKTAKKIAEAMEDCARYLRLIED